MNGAMMNAAKTNTTTELALLLVLATLWGASYTFIKIGVETIPPVTFIAARTLIAGAILLAIIAWRGLSLPRDLATWRRFAFQACMNSVVPFTLIAWAEQSVDAGLAIILNSTTPIFTFLMTAGITRHEPVTARKLFGVAAGMTGISLIIGMQAFGGLGHELWAQVAIVVATICYAGAAIFGRNFKGLNPLMPAAGSMISGAVLLVPLSLAVDRPWTLVPSTASIVALLGLVGVLDRARLRDLFPAGPDAGIGRRDVAGLSARADRGGDRCGVPGRDAEPERLDRTRMRRRGRRGNDHAVAQAGAGRRVLTVRWNRRAPTERRRRSGARKQAGTEPQTYLRQSCSSRKPSTSRALRFDSGASRSPSGRAIGEPGAQRSRKASVGSLAVMVSLTALNT